MEEGGEPPVGEPAPLNLPQKRILKALYVPDDPEAAIIRRQLARRAGLSVTGSTISLVLHGVHNYSYPYDAKGLLERRLVRRRVLGIDGIRELNYQLTPCGRNVAAALPDLPPVPDKSIYRNKRYPLRESEPQPVVWHDECDPCDA
jgi:hypothetical protein